MADTKLSGRGAYVLCGIAEGLVSNILTIIKIVVTNSDFIPIYLRKVHDLFLHNLSIILYLLQSLLDTQI